MNAPKKEFNGTPVEKELLFALLLLKEACDSLKGKPEDWQRLGRTLYIAQQAIDKCLKSDPKPAEQ